MDVDEHVSTCSLFIKHSDHVFNIIKGDKWIAKEIGRPSSRTRKVIIETKFYPDILSIVCVYCIVISKLLEFYQVLKNTKP